MRTGLLGYSCALAEDGTMPASIVAITLMALRTAFFIELWLRNSDDRCPLYDSGVNQAGKLSRPAAALSRLKFNKRTVLRMVVVSLLDGARPVP
jgi:hypothetical protein